MDRTDSGFGFLPEEGEAANLIRAHDWAATPLGHPSQWSASLRNIVRFLVSNPLPILLWWGPDYIQIYNDAYAPILGTKHPHQAMGKPFRECWHEVYDILGPMVDTPFNGGPSSWLDDIELIVKRHGFPEESHFTGVYSPVPDDSAPHGIGGVIATVTETTQKVIAERRVKILSELGARVAATTTDEDACTQAIAILSQHPKDVPFALLYLVDDAHHQLRLVSTCGIDPTLTGPAVLDLDTPMGDVVWPLAEALASETTQMRSDLSAVLPAVPQGPWADAPSTVAVVPVTSNVSGRPAGALVVGISAGIRLDDRYRSFLELVGSQVATAVAKSRAYDEERRRAEALAEIDRVKTLFFSNVSHEFRTPLTLMLAPLEDALAEPATPPRVRADLEIAQRNAHRLLKLVNSLLDFARIEAGRMQASFTPVDLSALTTDLSSTFRSAMQRAGLAFDVTCEPLGEPVYVNREMWEKIVLNMLSNAFKFTLQGKVSVNLTRARDHALLEVADTGVGVAQHEVPRLFERFHRVEHTEARTHEGSGIGLALVQELVRLHGGEISVDSTLGEGTTFRVRIPFGTMHLPAGRIEASPMASTATGAQSYVQEALRWLPDSPASPSRPAASAHEVIRDERFRSTFGSRIVLADDNADMRAYVRELLGRHYEVETAANGVEALAAVRRHRPDLLLADVMMPKMDGFQLLKALRTDRDSTGIPVILVSARAGDEARVEGLGAGADDYIVKPFQARELLARVGALLELTEVRRASEARFRAFVQATSDVVYRMSPDWSEMRHLEGRAFIADQLDPSRTWLEKYIHHDDRGSVITAIENAIRSKGVFELEHRVIRADGAVGWTFSRAIPVLDEHGDIAEWFGTATDITARKRAEAHLALLAKVSDDLVRLTNVDDTMESVGATIVGYLNASAFTFGEVDEDQQTLTIAHESKRGAAPSLKGEYRFRDFYTENFERTCRAGKIYVADDAMDAPRATAERRAALSIGAFVSAPLVRDGQWRCQLTVYDSTARHWLDDEVELIRELTVRIWSQIERFRANAIVKASEEQLRQADRRKDEFLAMLAHELRNPLAPIRTGLELIRLAGNTAASVDHVRRLMERQVAHMVRLIDDLLDVSRISSGKIQLQREPTPLAGLVQGAIDANRSAITAKHLRLDVDLPDTEVVLDVDPTRFVQVVSNLLHNAVKFTESTGSIRISARTTEPDGTGPHALRLSVSDTGIGIRPEFLPHVFELFTQGDRPSSAPGLGIGLALARRLVEMHGGRIDVGSDGPGHGSEFTIQMPLSSHAPVHHPIESAPARGIHCRVVVIDDNRDAAATMAMLVQELGGECRAAYDGETGLQEVLFQRPDVVLLDIEMPGTDGYEICRRIRRELGDAVVIAAVTGFGQERDRERASRAGFDTHLTKPADLTALKTLLRQCGPLAGAQALSDDPSPTQTPS